MDLINLEGIKNSKRKKSTATKRTGINIITY
jgi:hypothetical protein